MALHRYGDFRVEVFYFDSPSTSQFKAEHTAVRTRSREANRSNPYFGARSKIRKAVWHTQNTPRGNFHANQGSYSAGNWGFIPQTLSAGPSLL